MTTSCIYGLGGGGECTLMFYLYIFVEHLINIFMYMAYRKEIYLCHENISVYKLNS